MYFPFIVWWDFSMLMILQLTNLRLFLETKFFIVYVINYLTKGKRNFLIFVCFILLSLTLDVWSQLKPIIYLLFSSFEFNCYTIH